VTLFVNKGYVKTDGPRIPRLAANLPVRAARISRIKCSNNRMRWKSGTR